MLKKIAALAAMLVAGAAQAAGPYDGIYFNPSSSSYFSVHTNGTSMIAVGLSAVPANNLQFTTALGVVRVNSVATWEVATGSIAGNNAILLGTNLYGACDVTYDIDFVPGAAIVRIAGSIQSAVGRQSGINCAALTSTPVLTLPKAF